MIKGKEAYEEELISKYNLLESKEEQAESEWLKSLYRDEMRKIARVFKKNFHKPIEIVSKQEN